MAPVALVALLVLGGGHLFGGLQGADIAWLLLAGPVTAVPLLLFAFGARRITMATLGTLQYLSPSLQFALGVWLYGEPLEPTRLVGFIAIWVALAIYSADGFLWIRRNDSLGSLRSPPPRGSGPLPSERPRVRGPG